MRHRFKHRSYPGYDSHKSQKSGIPKGLAMWGEKKLEECTLEQLLLALSENGLPHPPQNETYKEGWAINELMTQ